VWGRAEHAGLAHRVAVENHVTTGRTGHLFNQLRALDVGSAHVLHLGGEVFSLGTRQAILKNAVLLEGRRGREIDLAFGGTVGIAVSSGSEGGVDGIGGCTAGAEHVRGSRLVTSVLAVSDTVPVFCSRHTLQLVLLAVSITCAELEVVQAGLRGARVCLQVLIAESVRSEDGREHSLGTGLGNRLVSDE